MLTFFVCLIALVFLAFGVSMALSKDMPRDARIFGTILFVGIAILIAALRFGLV